MWRCHSTCHHIYMSAKYNSLMVGHTRGPMQMVIVKIASHENLLIRLRTIYIKISSKYLTHAFLVMIMKSPVANFRTSIYMYKAFVRVVHLLYTIKWKSLLHLTWNRHFPLIISYNFRKILSKYFSVSDLFRKSIRYPAKYSYKANAKHLQGLNLGSPTSF